MPEGLDVESWIMPRSPENNHRGLDMFTHTDASRTSGRRHAHSLAGEL